LADIEAFFKAKPLWAKRLERVENVENPNRFPETEKS
jgi:hypothetical protein